MNKELTPLEALERIIGCSTIESHTQKWQEDYDIVKQALNDYENLKLKHRSMQDAVLEDFKKLKALEIIVEKKVDLIKLFNCFEMNNGYEFYNMGFIEIYKLTKEEYNLLKEVLNNGI